MPGIHVDLIRVDNRDPSLASNDSLGDNKSMGYAINQIYNVLANNYQSNQTPIVLAQGGTPYSSGQTAEIWSYFNV